eukprot:8687288-Alexandrium_andersonii.AAC.1
MRCGESACRVKRARGCFGLRGLSGSCRCFWVCGGGCGLRASVGRPSRRGRVQRALQSRQARPAFGLR